MLSNHATSDMRRRCAQLGADAVFDKSTEIEALVEYCLAVRAPETEAAAAVVQPAAASVQPAAAVQSV